MPNRMKPIKNQQVSYINGNTVRNFQTAPGQQRELERSPKEISNHIRKNRDKALSMNAGYVFFLAIAVCVTLGTCIKYLEIQADMSKRMNNIASLETKITDLKSDNDEMYSRINSSIDLEKIKKIAMEQLGMVYATKDQVVLYDSKESDYVRQYQDIPSESAIAKK